jgi:hypothetical protein
MYTALLAGSILQAGTKNTCTIDTLAEKLRLQQEKLHVVTNNLAEHAHLDTKIADEIEHLLDQSPLQTKSSSLTDTEIQEQIAVNESVTIYLTASHADATYHLDAITTQARSNISHNMSLQSLLNAYETTNTQLNTFINKITQQYLRSHVLKHMLTSGMKLVKNTNTRAIAKRVWPYAILFTHWIRNKTVSDLQQYNSVCQLYKQFLMELGIGGFSKKKPFIYPAPSGNPEHDMQTLQAYKNAGWAVQKQKESSDFFDSGFWKIDLTKIGFNIALFTAGNQILEDANEFKDYLKTNFKTPLEQEIAALEA